MIESSKTQNRPTLPEGLVVYAVGDIHGCADLLQAAVEAIDADVKAQEPKQVLRVFLGDYIDRGLDSRKTLDILIEYGRCHHSIFLMGNHEAVLAEFLRDPAQLHDWRQFGGLQTLISYGLRPSLTPSQGEQIDLAKAFAMTLPSAHRDFLANLAPSFLCGDFFFVHAGARPGIPLEQQTEEDLLWIRDEFLASQYDFGKFIVHGHSPVREPDLHSSRINIDTGAYATGKLTVLRIEGTKLQLLARAGTSIARLEL